MTGLIPALKVVDGIPRASSLDIATHFEKRHVDVMRAINNSVAQVPEKFAQRNFAFSDYQDSTGRTLPKCDLTHDGFSFVVMGFTGKKAAQWKVAYIMAFRAMAEQLESQSLQKMQQLPAPDASLSPSARAELKGIVDAKLSTHPARVQGKARAEIWTRFNRHFRIAEYAQLPAERMAEARDYLIELEVKALKALSASPKALPPDSILPVPAQGQPLELVAAVAWLNAYIRRISKMPA